MKCPNCSAKIPFMSIRNEFSCPSCSTRIRTTKGLLALVIAALADFAFFLVVAIGIKDNAAGTVVYLTVGTVLSLLIFISILKLERIG